MHFRPVSQDESSYDDDIDSIGHGYEKRARSTAFYLIVSILASIFTVSVAFNFILVNKKSSDHRVSSSAYIQLPFDQTRVLSWNTEYSGTNETEVDELWMNSIPWESGIIALRNEEAKTLNLPKSQPWPWDADRKSIYIINAHHILHCVRNLYISLQEHRHNKPQSVEWPHLLHCLDSIRQDTICLADDTPRYVPFNTIHGFKPGEGQHRACRNWDAMQEFVESHDPCYKHIEPGNKELSNLERFKFCPDDSEYMPTIREYFGYPNDWLPSSVVA